LPGEGATSSTTTTTTVPSTSTQIDYLTQVPDYRWTWSQSSYSGYITVSSVNSRRTKIGDPITYETTDKYEYAQMFTVDNDVTLQKVSLPLAIPLAYTLAYNPDVLNLLLTNYSLTINVMRSETLAGRTYPTPSDVVLESFNVKLRDIKVQTSLGNESVTPFVQEFPCSVALPKGTYFITMAIKEQYGGFGKSANVLIPALLEQVSGDVGLQTSLYTIANGSPAYPYTDPAFWAVSDPTRLFAPSTTTLPTFNVRGQAAILLDFNSPPKAATTVTSTSSTSTPAARFAQGVVGYQTFFVASPRTIQEKDRN
jgi:hypothetical protein